ncbi:uncharacterized protein [Diabrotica undecimpunctata]|uniref:uncharacterized protein n=1 Tax=Diabrotica undecimpunctata TaxID=50387 RepID=UPI003B642265
MKVLRKRLTTGTRQIIKSKNRNGHLTTNREETFKIVEDFYKLLCTSQRKANSREDQVPEILTRKKGILQQGSELLPEITIDAINLAIRKAKNNKSPGEDCEVTNAIKIGGTCLVKKIKNLSNMCLLDCNILDKWHNAKVILLYKKEDPHEAF